MRKLFCKPPFLVCLALVAGVQSLHANIPEPDVVFFGQVTGKVGALDVPVTEGQLSWEIRPEDSSGAVYKYQVDLAKLSGGEYSYSLKIPQEVLADIDTLMPQQENGLSIEAQKELFLKHYSISVNGEQAVLKDESLAFFASSQQNRAPYIQLDLEVSADALGDELDKNGNGIPDAWENHYNISDISADDDGDGWTNEEEYANGTDPTINNRVPSVGSESLAEDGTVELRVFEGGISQVQLKIYDSDTPPDQLEFTIAGLPAGLSLATISDDIIPLSKGDTLSAAQLNAGELYAQYSPVGFLSEDGEFPEPGRLHFSIQDNGPAQSEAQEGENPAVPVAVALDVFTPKSVGDPVRWIDASGVDFTQPVSSITGRSGNSLDQLAYYGFDEASGGFLPTGEVIELDESGFFPKIKTGTVPDQLLAFVEPDDESERLNLQDSGSVFMVHAADESDPTEVPPVFNDGHLSVWLENKRLTVGHANSLYFNQAFVEKVANTGPIDELAVILGESIIQVAGLHSSADSDAYTIELDGVTVGGPKQHTAEGISSPSSLAGFGFAMGTFGDLSPQLLPYQGQLGEFIAFPSRLTGVDKWLMNGYLMSKWKYQILYDYSQSIKPVTVEVPALLDDGFSGLLLGGTDDDQLIGGASRDTLVGGLGADQLQGNGGKDRFVIGDGDTVADFELLSGAVGPIAIDQLDVSELLSGGEMPLQHCLFFKPVQNDTVVKVNQSCQGMDLTAGTDFTDASFRILGQALWPSDMVSLWQAGALLTGNHKPEIVSYALSSTKDKQTLIINEQGAQSVYTAEIRFEGGKPFSGAEMTLPLKVGALTGGMLQTGKATLSDDFDLYVHHYFDPYDSELIQEITGDQYQSYEELYGLSDAELAAMDIYPDYELERHYQRVSLVSEDGITQVPLAFAPTDDGSHVIRLLIEPKVDQVYEGEEVFTLTVGNVPEYYELQEGKDTLTITLTDGLDKVYATNTKSTVSEGQSGSFTLHRTGSIDQPLVVDVMLSGLAENGTDYSTIPSQLTFAEGEDTLTIPVQAMTDEVSEPMELLELRIVSSDRYDIDATRNLAQLTIQDEALNFVDTDKDGLPDSWELASGLNPNVSNLQGDGYRDSDGDGLSDQDEYRLGTDPMKADSDGDGVADGSDTAPLDAEVKDMQGLKGYQVVQLGTQSVLNVPLGMDRIIDIPLHYLTSDGSDQANGLQLMLQYNADQLEYLGVNQVLSTALASTGSPTPKAVYRGGYKLFTHQVPVTWDASGGDWPGMPLPTALLHARFKLPATATVGQQLMVGVDAVAAEGYAFKPVQLQVNVVAPSQMEILANELDVAEEGVMLARHLAGLSPEMPEMTAEEAAEKLSEVELARIAQHIHTAGLQYDVDGDGVVNPLSDAVLIYHYLKNGTLTDEQVQQVLGADTAVTAAEVIAKIREIQEAL